MEIIKIIADIGTFLIAIFTAFLWWETRKNAKKTEDAFKLNILTSLIIMHKPAYGQTSSDFESLQRRYMNLVNSLFKLNTIRDLFKVNFSPEEIKDIKRWLYIKEQ